MPSRTYDHRALIDVYIQTRHSGRVDEDWAKYYTGLLGALETLFGLRLSQDVLTFNQRVLWGLFQSTIDSYLSLGTPWDVYLEAGLIYKKLQECGDFGKTVFASSDVIQKATKESRQAHRDMLHALFQAIFGAINRVVTSAELAAAGFDDSIEPTISDD